MLIRTMSSKGDKKGLDSPFATNPKDGSRKGATDVPSSAGAASAPASTTATSPASFDTGDLRSLLSENPEGFQVNTFIEKLIKPLLDPDATRPGRPIRGTDFGFDPMALHDLFSSTLDKLYKLGKEVDEKIGAIQDDGRKMAPQRKKELDRHHRSLQEVGQGRKGSKV